MGEGWPTGIKREDIENENVRFVRFRGRQMEVALKEVEYLPQGRITLELDPLDGPCLLVHGYYSGTDFIAERCEVVPC